MESVLREREREREKVRERGGGGGGEGMGYLPAWSVLIIHYILLRVRGSEWSVVLRAEPVDN